MANELYTPSGVPATGAAGASSPMRAQFTAIEAAFDKFPAPSTSNGRAVVVNTGGTGYTVTTGTLALAGNFATTGAFNTTLIQGASVSLTLPVVSGTLATLAGTETLSNKTFVAPVLGTPASGVATNLTGTAAGLTAGSVTTNANLTGHITSTGNAAVLGAFTLAQLNAAVSDADVATLAGAETLSNKTLTSPVINSPTMDWPTIDNPTFNGTIAGTAVTPVANGGTGAATLTGVVKGNGTGAFTAAVAGTDYLAPAGLGTGVATALAVNVGSVGAPLLTYAPLTNSLGANVALNNIANYFDGPSVAQGTSGTWFVSGTITAADTAGTAAIHAKLWDGTTVIAACRQNVSGANGYVSISLSGFITSPAANLRISARDLTSTSGAIVYNVTGTSKDSTITAVRIA